MRAYLAVAFSTIVIAACGTGEFSDLKEFVDQSGQGLRGRVEPLPQVKPYEPMSYNAFDLPDPFKPRKIEPEKGSAGSGPAPDLSRRKEPLEAYPLESLKMVGTLERANQRWALIKTPDNNLYRVRKGNFMGQNFGTIAMITESSITLKELIQDTTGSWSERTSNLQLQEEEEKKR
ncbi:MAG: pilus assembly protein PilP [Proteobacteria bacterium]|nr:MAG: pilus assembly protein PilP [Pseudomonadota bacterium]